MNQLKHNVGLRWPRRASVSHSAIGLAFALSMAALTGCRGHRTQAGVANDSAKPASHAKTLVSNGGGYKVSFVPVPDPIPMNEPFSLDVTVRPSAENSGMDLADLSFSADAAMPAHAHGMTTRARATPLGDGRYRVDGMLFHMPGHWQLYFDIGRGSIVERAQVDIHLE